MTELTVVGTPVTDHQMAYFRSCLRKSGFSAEDLAVFVDDPQLMKEWIEDGKRRLDNEWYEPYIMESTFDWSPVQSLELVTFRRAINEHAAWNTRERMFVEVWDGRFPNYKSAHYLRAGSWINMAMRVQMRLLESDLSKIEVRVQRRPQS